MLVHAVRAAAAFVAILIAYWTYALLAAPLFEPRVTYRDNTLDADGSVRPRKFAAWRHEELQQLFPEGAWERESRKVIETPQGKLLFRDYQPLEDGRIRIEPCTLVFYTASPGSQKRGRPVIMRTPEGALLQFDRPLDLARAEIGRLVEARLLGEVKIHSAETEPGKHDDLEITTRDVHLAEDHIKTPHQVDFRFGRNFGGGRDLKIMLLPADEKGSGGGPMFDGVRSLELFHLDRIRLYMQAKSLFAGAAPPQGELPDVPAQGGLARGLPGQSPPALNPPAYEPVDVTCSGPYRFDFEQRVASFEDNVQVVHEIPNAPSDRLTCNRLEVYFAPREQPAEAGAAAEKEPKPADDTRSMPVAGMTVQRLVALGAPAVLVSPSRGAEARAEHLEYDFDTRQMYLEDRRKVMLRGPHQYVEAIKLRYEMAPQGRLGRLWADGPGRFDGALRAEGGRRVAATWRKRLRLLPHDGAHVLSLVEGASVNMQETGGFRAGEIHIWLKEIAKPQAQPQTQPAARPSPDLFGGEESETEVVPDRMLALGNVEIDTTRLTGGTERLEAWFRYVDAPPVAPAAGVAPVIYVQENRTAVPSAYGVGGHAARSPAPAAAPALPDPRVAVDPRLPGAAAMPTAGRGFAPQAPATPGKPPAKRYDMRGKLIQIQLVKQGEAEPALETALIVGAAHLRELAAVDATEPPLDVRGDKLHLTGGETPSATVNVYGRPAHVAARGLTMTAGNVHLDRGANRLWIEGPGAMTLPPKAAAAGSASRAGSALGTGISAGAPVRVTWQERMEFDGNVVHFQRDVRTQTRQVDEEEGGWTDISTHGDVLDASVSRFVDFSDDEQEQDDVELRRLVYDGGVWLESHGFDRGGARQSWDRMQLPNLTLDQLTGELSSRGTGWIQSVRLGSGDPLTREEPRTPLRPTEQSRQQSTQLNYTRVDYQQGIGGNIHNREVTFRDQVQTVYGPVPTWESQLYPDRPDGLGEKGVVINSDELAIYEMGPWVSRRRRAVELLASGNAVVEGRAFNAHANRLKYAEAKDLVVLEGDGRRDAELWRQEQIGGPRSHAAARQIWFWRGENRIEVDDARFIDLTQLGARP